MASEKRRSKRIPVKLTLAISDLYRENQEDFGIHDLASPIKIINISSHGLAFTSACVLPEGFCFNASLDFEDKSPTVFTEVRIVRSSAISSKVFSYGCEFTNLPEGVAEIIDKYSL